MERNFFIKIRERNLKNPELAHHVRTIQAVGRETLDWFFDLFPDLRSANPLDRNLSEAQLAYLERLYFGALRLSQILSEQAIREGRINPRRSVWFNPEMQALINRAREVFTPQTLVWQLDGIGLLRQRGGLKEVYAAGGKGWKSQFDGVFHDVLGSATSLNLGAEFPYASIVGTIASQMGIGDNFCLPYHPGLHQITGAEVLSSLYPNPTEVYIFTESSGTAVNSAAIEAVCAYGESVFPGKLPKVLQIDGTWCGGLGTAKEGTGFGVASQAEKRGTRWVDRCLPLPTAENRDWFLKIVEEKIARGEAAGIFLEPIVGDAGIVPVDPQLIKELIKILKQGANGHPLPIIVDTVQQGTGRTGNFWGIEHLPELQNYPYLVLTTAKSSSNGQPFGFMIIPKQIAEKAYPLSMITTNSGNGGLLRAVVVAKFVTDPRIQEIIDKNAQIIDEVATQYGLNLRGLRMNRGIETGSRELMELIQWHLFIKYGILVGALPATVRFQPMLLESPSTIRNITEAVCRGISEIINGVVLDGNGNVASFDERTIPEEVVISYQNSNNPSGLNR
ncbi:MAG: aminotransferase class III-fold pyridoxal phosphate-dependent enzyme [candidate division WOR-3 bacterium]